MSSAAVSYLCLQATREGQASHAHVHEMIRGLAPLGFDVTLYEPAFSSDLKVEPGALSRALEFRRVEKRLEHARCPELLYVRGHFAAIGVSRWARRRGLPVIQEVNGPYGDLFDAWPWTRRFRTRFERMMREQYASADALITVTPELASWLWEETGHRDITVVPNGANVEVFTPEAPPSPGLPERYVLFFGALAPWQGVDTLLAALRLPEWPEDVDLVVAGDGALRAAVEAAAQTDKRVRYLGRVAYKRMPGVIAGALATVCPQKSAQRSWTGLSPLKLYESLACATPVVASALPGVDGLLTDGGCGLTVGSDAPRELAAAIGVLAAEPDVAERMGARGRDLVVRHHSWATRAAETAVVMRRVLAK